ncbi:10245_t:CDS:2 [Diversispora eburnea]|uniref:Protein-S-isoprenylcysteine O-methyltransferase n=1 Tax=Diversispora eburnea TaxID=1213867 RepID=A0A9N9ABT2_9GLOM|nr:10245_t:CDS:2 [Diversispora eburnea]
MYTKIIAFVIQNYVHFKAFSPPNPSLSTKKIMLTEGIVGIVFAQFLPTLVIIFNLMQSLLYIHVMYQQEISSIPILPDENYKFSEWNLLDIVWFLCIVGGSLLRIWCFKCLKAYFTFHVTIKKKHKLITTGPYSLLVHPSYTGATLVTANYLMTYRLCYYIPLYLHFSFNWNIILILCIMVFASGNMIANIMVYKRITYEEAALKKRFGKAWDVYFSQRKSAGQICLAVM